MKRGEYVTIKNPDEDTPVKLGTGRVVRDLGTSGLSGEQYLRVRFPAIEATVAADRLRPATAEEAERAKKLLAERGYFEPGPVSSPPGDRP